MADQLRVLCTIAGSIPTLTSLSISARRTVLDDGDDGIPVPTPFLPILSPLLSLTHLERLAISIGDYIHSDTHSGWVSDEDCSVICQLPSLTDLSVNEGKWRREGLLEHLSHSDEAAEFRARATQLDVRDYALDAETKQAFRELQLACPLIAATLQN